LSFPRTQLWAFLAVVEQGSLRAAADVLGVSPAAVSSSLASLRRAVGVPLFAREGRGVKLTAAGTSFVEDVRRMMALSAGSIASAKAAMQEARPPLRLGAVGAASEAFLGELLAKFMANEPDVPVELQVVSRKALWALIEERKVDIGFAEMPPKSMTLQLLAIRQNEYVVAAAGPKRCDKATLAKSLWLLREPGSGTRTATEEFFRDYGISPARRTIGSAAAIVRCIGEGVGVSLMPRDVIAADVRAGTMQIVRTPFTPRPRPWYFITAADRDVSLDTNRFLEIALKTRAFVAT
jgi:DNA-binding transcriptional LysR family regulator